MVRQLVLIDVSTDWRLDEHTREVGRRGIAEARDILEKAAERERLTQGRKSKRPAA